MKTYKVKTMATFEGYFEVRAENREQARECVEKHCGIISPNIHTSLSDDEVINWEFPVHPEKKIVSIKQQGRQA